MIRLIDLKVVLQDTTEVFVRVTEDASNDLKKYVKAITSVVDKSIFKNSFYSLNDHKSNKTVMFNSMDILTVE